MHPYTHGNVQLYENKSLYTEVMAAVI